MLLYKEWDPNFPLTDRDKKLLSIMERECFNHNDYNEIKTLLEGDANPNYFNENGNNPLIMACFLEHKGLIKNLLKFGANPNTVDNFCYTPLMETINIGDFESSKLLLEYGADPNLSTSVDTPLSCAIIAEEFELVQLLISHNVDVNYNDKNGRTSLFLAIHTRNFEIVKLLLENGADTTIVSIFRSNTYIAPEFDNSTVLFVAAFISFDEAVKLLLEYKAKIDFDIEKIENQKTKEILYNSIGDDSLKNICLHDIRKLKFSLDNLPETFFR